MGGVEGRDDALAGLVDLGERLRRERERQGVSLRELARRIGVSASLISQIERDKVRPSVATLYQIVSELDGSLDRLLFAEPGEQHPTGDGRATPPDHPMATPVQPRKTRKVIRLQSGVRWERLTSSSVPGIDFLYVVYEPGGESAPSGKVQRHPGREWGHVLRGELHVTIADDDYVLGPGDSVTFDSSLPHRLWNQGVDDVHGVWFVLGR